MTKTPVKRQRLGIIGGSFNPIHNGHLAAVDEAVSVLKLDRVIFVPCGVPPHKPEGVLADAEDRYLMTVLAVAEEPRYEVSRYEIDKSGPSYSVDTVWHFHDTFPEAEIFFITGIDAISEVETWHNPEELFKMCTVIAMSRPRFEDLSLPAAAKQAKIMEMPPYDISATYIRKRLAGGLPVDRMTPDGVIDYIKSKKLYQRTK